MEIKKVGAHKGEKPIPSNSNKVQLNYPEHILFGFKKIIKDSALPGTKFYNPYTNKEEQFPESAYFFTAIHLQIIARNEEANTDGRMKTNLYHGTLSDVQIAKIRCLVKATTICGVTEASHYGESLYC